MSDPFHKEVIQLSKQKLHPDIKRIFFILLGFGVFTFVYSLDPLPDAVDPNGKGFTLTSEGKAAIALFLLAGIWWVFEVIPIGVTSLAIGAFQVLFLIRPASVAFRDFMDPSVMFIFGSLIIGMVFTKVGLTKRLAYKILTIVGERTSMIYLGCFFITAALTHIMAHTAVAATMFPILMSIYSLYSDEDKPTRFGKGLFIGMAFVAGAGSMITLLGAARGAVAIVFLNDITGRNITFFELSYYMFPIGWLMVILCWFLIMIMFKPEKSSIPGLTKKARYLYRETGPLSPQEKTVAIMVLGMILVLFLKSFIPALAFLDKTAVVLTVIILFFMFRILTVKDLEQIPWNIVLLFSGAMSIGHCLWETGAANWLAVNWLIMFHHSHWLVFVLGIAVFIMIMTNFIMNVAAIAISLPVALVTASYLNISPDVVFFTALLVSACPFLLLVGAAPNAIAYGSRQFTATQFFIAGIPASLILLAIVTFAVAIIWPLMGMPITNTIT